VKALITGRVVHQGDELSISVDLVQTRDGRHIWGKQYRRKFTEIFSVQQELVGQISENLRLELTGEEKKTLTKRYTENTEAYQLYLKGRYSLNQGTIKNVIDRAIGYFMQAIDEDPAYALAYAGLADAHYAMSNLFEPSSEAMPKMKAAATQALQIDESLGEAHASLGLAKLLYDRDWAGAEQGFQRALQLNPGYANAHLWYGLCLTARARFDEALVELNRAKELDPLTPHVGAYASFPLFFARRYDEALTELHATMEMDPDYYLPHAIAGLVYEQTGELSRSIEEFEKAGKLEEEAPLELMAQLGRAYAVAGRTTEAEQVLDQLTQLSEESYVSAYNIALIHAGLGQNDRAFEWLEKADEERSEYFPWLNVDPRLDSLRSDPRFLDLLRRIE
jgi:tetratricopeptide (TPR) repeat protein